MGEVAPRQRSGPSVVGQYELHEVIASGGMATVHRGRRLGEGGFTRFVAIKRLHPHFATDNEFVAMLNDEARLAAHIHHPNVVAMLDVVTSDGEVFVVMELVEGFSLADLWKRGGPCTAEVAASVAHSVLLGLHAAHEAKDDNGAAMTIIHRDVSPQNVMISNDGVVRLIDFGIAKAAGRLQKATRFGHVKGKLGYLAPEQFNGKASRQSDIYSTSVLLWEGLTGQRLFDGDSEAAILNQVLRSRVRAPSEVCAALPRELDRVVMRGLSRDPRKRFATANEMAEQLRNIIPLASVTELAAWAHARGAGAVVGLESAVVRVDARVNPAGRGDMLTARRFAPVAALLGGVVVAGGLVWRVASAPPAPSGSVVLTSRAPAASAPQASPVQTTTAADELGAPAPLGRPAAEPTAATPRAPSSEPPRAIPELAGKPNHRASATHALSTAKQPSAARLNGARHSSEDCSSPYVVDIDGIRRIRRECL